ncbi:hypothetical protein [Peredibacter starrii]|uniref:Uncharacterized protein n=1 Tax=Peredibacter starrii TaxID=28202 RepID=A0AAX4HS27_9BACT|nr:hypothetical protein [Peredibacter starrii]WPU65990.1 hypothetical protein SOO65_04460 [Peredibacter starrii]
MKKILSLIIFMALSLSAVAGNEVGNGGGVLYQLKSNTPIMFFDAFETEARYGYRVQWPREIRNDREVAMAFTSRLAKYDPKLQRQLNNWIKAFYSEAVFSETDLPVIFDMGTGIHIPEGTGIAQLVIQTKSGYILNQRYWNRLSSEQRGVAILHEVIYRKALEVNPRLFSSVKVRTFVAILISNELRFFTADGYQGLLQNLELK